MVELKLRKILRKLKSKHPQTRYDALGELFQFKQQDDLQVQVEVLVDCVKVAASKFPERVDHWDNPSYYLIDFVCDFPMPQIMEALMKHFDDLDIYAKERTIEFLLSTEDDKAFYFLQDKIIHLIQTEEFPLPIRALGSYPVLVKNILNATLDKIHTDYYKFMFYPLLSIINDSGLDQGYKKEFILPLLLEDYQAVKQEYLQFDPDYSTRFVYVSWTDSYFLIRNKMCLLIRLMNYYFSAEIAKELKDALSFRDPIIKTDALLVCISKSLPYDDQILLECATHIESAEMLYWNLLEHNWEHLYPVHEEVQLLLAKTRFFHTMADSPNEDGTVNYPEDIEIVDHLDTENIHGRLVRYYLIRFKVQNTEYAGWAGGYSLEAEDAQGTIWDETYSDYVEFDSVSIEEHKQKFLERRGQYFDAHENHVFYESSPKLGSGVWLTLGLLLPITIKIAYTVFESPLIFIFTIVALAIGWSLNETRRNKKKKVLIIGDQLVVQHGSKQQSIELQEIEKIEYDRKNVFVYNKKLELAFKFPLKWVHYFLFQQQMNENVAHFKNRPFIQA
ncbi:hypothetical protein MHB50_02690 [Siminovitchia sp. FSL H7-0308]|uniref:hypothetical protein n=1 Tax=Siminovitchia sp. FSL H7-0308 TaxID=2921432 RepID=UPI0030EED978